jgi:UDP-N-acetyl-2-amino-2-deoxyglucuronate dehydrogenase
MSLVRFALVGCGRIAAKHIEALTSLPEANVVCVCDTQEERAAFYGKKLGVPFYRDYHSMLRSHSVDVVTVLTPSGWHASHTIDIVKNYRTHIVCEKPMALQLEDADEMIRVCDENKVRLFIVKQNRYNLPVLRLRRALEEGRFGKLVMGTVRVRWCRTQDYYDKDKWRGTWALDGGCLANQASHHIDLLEWMMGEPVEVTAKTATRLLNIEVEDTAAVLLKFSSGALGIIEATVATRPKDLEGSLSLLGEKGSVEIGGFAVNEIKTWCFEKMRPEDDEIRLKYSECPPNVYGFGHRRYLEEVIRALVRNEAFPVDGREGRKSLELLCAIYESSREGRAVSLPSASSRRMGFK